MLSANLWILQCVSGIIWPPLHRFSPECSNYQNSMMKGPFSSKAHQPGRILHHIVMKLILTIVSLAALFSVAYADIEPVRVNPLYGNPQTSWNDVACSNGVNGLITKGFSTIGSLPTFPNVGGTFAVNTRNSPECGSCWTLTYEGTGRTIYFTAIDTAPFGFELSPQSVNTLTNGQANQSSVIYVQAAQVSESFCGL